MLLIKASKIGFRVENRVIMKRVVYNLGIFERLALSHLVVEPETINYNDERKIFKEIMNNPQILNEIKKNIHTKDTILDDLEKFTKLKDQKIHDQNLYNKIIQVGEFKN